MADLPEGPLSTRQRPGGMTPRVEAQAVPEHPPAVGIPGEPARHRLIDPALLAVAFIWGGNFVVYKIVLETVPPLALVGVRFGLMPPVLFLLLWLRHERLMLRREDLLCLLWAGLVVMGGQQVTFIIAVDMTSASEAALLITSAPIFTALIAVLSGQERLSKVNWLGVLVGFVGVTLVLSVGLAGSSGGGSHLTGNLIMLGSAMLYGYFMALSRDLVRRYGGLKTVAYCYALSCVAIVPLSLPQLLATPWARLDLFTWALLVGYIGLLAGLWAFAVWYTTIGRTSAAATAVYQYLVPVVAMAAAAMFLGEKPQTVQLAGAVIVLAGLGFARWTPGRKPL